jgi:ribose transport system substrate-binding protein
MELRRIVVTGLSVAGMVVGVAACGSSSSSSTSSTPSAGSSSTTSGDSSSSGSSDAAVAAAKADVAAHANPPTLSGGTPVKAPKGKTLGILSCGQASPDCRDMAVDATTAAHDLGWNAFTIDGQLSAQGWAAGLSQAVQRKPAVILSIVAADAAMPQALAQAHAAHIPVVCAICANTFSKPVADPSTVNVDVNYADQAKVDADYIISQTNGHAKVAALGYALAVPDVVRLNAFKAELARCSGCSVAATGQIQTGSNLVGLALNATQPILSSNGSSLNYIMSPGDVFTPGVIQAIKLSGNTNAKAIGYDCNQPVLTAIREGQPDAGCADTPLDWAAWAGVDAAARLVAGQTAKNVFIPFQFVTKATAPAAGKSPTTFDYITYYKHLWGLS